MRSLHHIIAAATLAIVWVGLPALSALHVSLEEHSYCSEHASLEEGASADHDAITTGAADRPDASVRSAPSVAHQACNADVFSLREGVTVTTGAVIDVAAPTTPVDAVAPAFVAPSIALLHLAPKSSPPLAA